MLKHAKRFYVAFDYVAPTANERAIINQGLNQRQNRAYIVVAGGAQFF